MASGLRIGFLVLIVGVSISACSTAVAQQRGRQAKFEAVEVEDSLYYQQPTQRPDARAIIQQKAQMRAAQRNSRMASLSWYGMSNGRPTAAPTPFTSLYSPVWQMPGGRPYAWYPSMWPSYIIVNR
jgi:hypothetical protein